MFNRITAVQVEPDYRLGITYDDGEVIHADFRSVVSRGGVFSPLADPDFFSLAALDTHGRAVAWPGELEFCADALRLEWGRREPRQSSPAPQKPATEAIENVILVEDL